VLHDAAGAGGRGKEQFCGGMVVPWKAWVFVVVHLGHWGGQGGIGLFITPGVRGVWTRFMAIVGMVSLVAGWLLRLSILLW